MDLAAKIIAFLAVSIAVLTILNSILRKSSSRPKDFPYRSKEYLLSAKESGILNLITKIAGHNIVIFSKVNLAKLVGITNNARNTGTHLQRLKSYNVDFVLCSPVNYAILLAVIIDNSRGNSAKRYDELYHILNVANIKFITLQSSKTYDIHEISSLLRQTIGQIGEVAINV